jgi:AraC family transcriptional regulator
MSYEVKVTEIKRTPTITIRGVTTADKLGEHFMDVMPRLGRYAEANGMNVIGPPFARYFDYSPERVELEAGFPLASSTNDSDGFLASELPSSKAATLTHWGDYEGLKAAYEFLADWIKTNGYEYGGAPWEVYVTDPGNQPDKAKWQTDIYWPIK